MAPITTTNIGSMMEDKFFTATEVGTLIEGFQGQLSVVAEGVVSLQNDMVEVKDRLTKLEVRVGSIEDVIRINIPGHERRITALESKVR